MTDGLPPSREQEIDEEGRDPTQRRIDEDGTSGAPADEPWVTREDDAEEDAAV